MGETSSKMIAGLMRLRVFHTVEGIPSGPGAKERENLSWGTLISSLEMGAAEWSFVRRPLPGRGFLGGKKWSGSALLIATGLEA